MNLQSHLLHRLPLIPQKRGEKIRKHRANADSCQSRFRTGEMAGVLDKSYRMTQQDARLRNDLRTSVGRSDTGRSTAEQLDPKFLLQRLDAAAERWLRNMKQSSSGGERATVREPHRVTKSLEIHKVNMRSMHIISNKYALEI